MSDIFKEVDEELRQEHYAKLWKKYGSYIIAAAVAIVLASGGYTVWKDWRQSRQAEYGARFLESLSLASRGEREKALEGFAALARDANTGYATLARFEEAALLARGGDLDGAIAVYEALAADSSVDRIYRDLAVIHIALHRFDAADPVEIMDRLAPLVADDNPWRFSAMELTALAARRAGDSGKARDLLQRITDDTAASPGLRARATELLAAIGG